MKKIFILFSLFGSSLIGLSQTSISYTEIGNMYYKKGDYRSAIHYFEKFLSPYYEDFGNAFTPYAAALQQKEIKPDDYSLFLDAMYKTAVSYRQLSIHDKAASYFKELLKKKTTKYPLAKFYLATELKYLGQFEDSKKWLQDFLNEYKKNDAIKKEAQNVQTGIEFITSEISKKESKYFTIRQINFEQRDTGAYYGPIFTNDSTLFLNSTKANYNLSKNIHLNRVFEAVKNGETLTQYLPVVGMQQDGPENQAASSMSEDGNEVYLTRWNYRKGKKISRIYISKKTIKGWTAPIPITELNDTLYNTQQPFVTNINGKKVLFFSSDRKGGFGGYDLYISSINDNGIFGKAINLGSLINTEFDEVAPYFHRFSQQLVFASNGLIGLGGYDLYSTPYPAVENAVKNLGFPINSIKDDIYFTSKSTNGELIKDCWVSTDRFSQCCLQAIHIVNHKPDYELAGRIVNCDNQQPLKNAEILFSDPTTGTVKYTAVTSENGSYRIKVDKLELLTATYKLKNYISKVSTIAPLSEDEFLLQNKENCLIPLIEKKSIVLEKIYFEYDKATLLVESQVQLDSLITILADNPNMIIQIEAHTDSVGSEKYNLDLSDARAKSVVSYLIEKGINKDRLSSKGFGETMPIEPNSNPDGTDNPAGRARNRRCAFTIIKI